MAPAPSELTSFPSIYDHLVSTYSYPILPSPSPNPHSKQISHAITNLSLHPTLEALLHILNADLSSAHFLCRHMESAPAYEAMFIHGLLHRVEGDYRNTDAWYGDVCESEVFQSVWGSEGGLEGAKGFVKRIEGLRKEGKGDKEALVKESGREIEALKDFLVKKFGTEEVEDASTAWVGKSEKGKEAAKNMVVGGEGWRQF